MEWRHSGCTDGRRWWIRKSPAVRRESDAANSFQCGCFCPWSVLDNVCLRALLSHASYLEMKNNARHVGLRNVGGSPESSSTATGESPWESLSLSLSGPLSPATLWSLSGLSLSQTNKQINLKQKQTVKRVHVLASMSPHPSRLDPGSPVLLSISGCGKHWVLCTLLHWPPLSCPIHLPTQRHFQDFSNNVVWFWGLPCTVWIPAQWEAPSHSPTGTDLSA